MNHNNIQWLKQCQYWIFDMDGTLTLPIHDFEDIRKQLGIASGTPILEAIEGMSPEQADRTKSHLHEIEMELAYQAQPQPGVEVLLDTLRNSGKQLGILTRNGEEITHATLKAAGLSKFFNIDTIVGRDTCAPKPKPDGVHYLLDLWEAPRQQAVIVGDYLYDIQAGFDAGINTVHFDSVGQFLWPEFTHYRIQKLSDLVQLFSDSLEWNSGSE